MKKNGKAWAWFWMTLGILYFFMPLLATFLFSLRAKLGVLSFAAYENIFRDPNFIFNFSYSVFWGALTIMLGILIFVPTAYIIRLRLPQFRAPVEFITLLPFVIPAIVYVFSLVRTFSKPPLLIVDSPVLLVAAYAVLSMPYMYSAIDTGLRAIDVRTLTEAAQS
ncbi:MAG: spermidine/putrescine ABC transporter permease, partial [Chloroflexi bacterium]